MMSEKLLGRNWMWGGYAAVVVPKRSLAETVQHYRWQANLSQGKLAIATGLSKSFISQLESGRYKTSEPPTLQKIANALGAPLKDFLEAAGIEDAPEYAIPVLPPEVAALQAAGVPDKDLQELAAKWEGLTEEDRDLLLTVTRSMWERRQARAAMRSQHKAGNPSQPATD